MEKVMEFVAELQNQIDKEEKPWNKEVNVWVKEKNYELPVKEITPYWAMNFVNHRVFETINDVQMTMMALNHINPFAYERGFSCPVDGENAIEFVKNLQTY